MSDVLDRQLKKIDELLKLSEDNGWNAAINACRKLLPVQYSQKLRPLYRETAETAPVDTQEK